MVFGSFVLALVLVQHTGDTGLSTDAFDSSFETINLAQNHSFAQHQAVATSVNETRQQQQQQQGIHVELMGGVHGAGAEEGPYDEVIKKMHAELLEKFPKALGRCVS